MLVNGEWKKMGDVIISQEKIPEMINQLQDLKNKIEAREVQS